MGVLSDLIVAPASDATRILDDATPHGAFHRVDVKGTMDHHLVALARIVFPGASEVAEALFQSTPADENAGPWLFQFPRALTRRLARLEPHHQAAVARKLEKALREDGEPGAAANAGALVDIVCQLAQRAVKEDHALFLWVSL